MASQKKKVCIIGAGPAGLACIKVFKEKLDKFDIICYEKGSQIGGNWVYTEETGEDKHGEPIHSCVYSNLTVNLPKQLMQYPEFPYPDDFPCYFGHRGMLKYLNRYTKNFNLEEHIQFNTKVVAVRPNHIGEGLWGTTWFVGVQPSNGSTIQATDTEFDAVIVCNGRYTVPSMPDYPGLSQFEGSKIHSKSYRIPDGYKDQTVLIVGGSVSGWEITQDVAACAKHIFVSHHAEHKFTAFPQNVELVTAISKLTKNGAVLTDGRQLTFDSVIFGTGYQYSFPFLSSDCGVQYTKNIVRPLYKHTISIANPTLSFVSIADWLAFFPFFPVQANFILAVLEERVQLPSIAEMKKYEEGELKLRLDRGWPERYFHRFEDLQFDFYDELAQAAGVDKLPRWFRPLAMHCFAALTSQPMKEVKSLVYRVIGPASAEVITKTGTVVLKEKNK